MASIISLLKIFFQNILTSGTHTSSEISDIKIRRKFIFLNAIILLALFLLIVFGIRAYFTNLLLLALADSIFCSLMLLTFLVVRFKKMIQFGSYALLLFAFVFFLYLVISGGSANSGSLWVLSYPLISIYLLGLKPGVILSSLFIIISSIIIIFFPHLTMVNYSINFSIPYVGSFLLVFSLSIVYENIRVNNEKQLEQSKQQLEENHKRLLYTSQELLHEKKQTDSIFHNVHEGIFLIDKEFRVGTQYSKTLERIFEEKFIGQKQFIELLGSKLPEKLLSATKDYLGMFFTLKIDEELLKEANPLDKAELHYEKPNEGFKTKYIMFSFSRVFQEDGSIYVLATARDVTDETLLSNKLKYEEDKNKKLMTNLFQIIHVEAELLDEFITDAESELTNINQILRSQKYENKMAVDFIYKAIHNIKGNASSIELIEFSKKLHSLEEDLKVLQEKGDNITWEKLLELTYKIAEVQNEINDIKSLIEKVLAFQSNIRGRKESGQTYLLKTLQLMVDRAQKELGKEIELVTNDFDVTLITDKHRRVIKDVCIQLARNSIFHGIEPPEERLVRNKARKGRIELVTKKNENKMTLIFKDDGCGLDPDIIKEKAKSFKAFKKLDIDTLSPQQVVGLIFHPGFSTALEATTHAGRGVGMNFVKSAVNEKGGNIAIRTVKGKLCEFHITFPS